MCCLSMVHTLNSKGARSVTLHHHPEETFGNGKCLGTHMVVKRGRERFNHIASTKHPTMHKTAPTAKNYPVQNEALGLRNPELTPNAEFISFLKSNYLIFNWLLPEGVKEIRSGRELYRRCPFAMPSSKPKDCFISTVLEPRSLDWHSPSKAPGETEQKSLQVAAADENWNGCYLWPSAHPTTQES